METGRGGAAATTWIVRLDGSSETGDFGAATGTRAGADASRRVLMKHYPAWLPCFDGLSLPRRPLLGRLLLGHQLAGSGARVRRIEGLVAATPRRRRGHSEETGGDAAATDIP